MLIETGRVYVWGFGALGLGKEIVECQRPQLIQFPEGVNVKKIACSINHTVALSGTNKSQLMLTRIRFDDLCIA